MPELPEVETIARTLRPQVQGRRVKNAAILREKTLEYGQSLLPVLEGARITNARRRGKLLLLDLEDGAGKPFMAAFHLKMTGRLFVHPMDIRPNKHTKITMELYGEGQNGPESRLFFDDMRCFGYFRLMRPEDLAGWPFWESLGPEPLENSPEALAARLSAHKGKIKGLLLDQTIIAGIGNIYADESLFRAGIRPDRKMEDILAREKARAGEAPALLTGLARHIREILQEAVQACGSSIRDYRDAEGNAGAFQNSFRVYGRRGENCLVCCAPLEQTRVAGRGTTFCPRCQK